MLTQSQKDILLVQRIVTRELRQLKFSQDCCEIHCTNLKHTINILSNCMKMCKLWILKDFGKCCHVPLDLFI